jgi:lysyl-tRNA synthetase class 2
MVEFYEAYADYNDVADRLETLVRSVAEQVGTSGPIDFESPWRRVKLSDAIRDATGVDFLAHPDRDGLAGAIGNTMATEGRTWPQLVDDLLSTFVEPTLEQPTFLMDYPVELSPFAKAHRSQPGLVERWEAFCGGVEIANAFTELNDPDEQRARFESQARLAAEGDDEAAPYDEVFVEALEHGMPPTGGVGLGIDRLVMALRDRSSIREVVLFPAMRDA